MDDFQRTPDTVAVPLSPNVWYVLLEYVMLLKVFSMLLVKFSA